MDKKAMDRVRAQRRGHRSVTTRLIHESKAIMEDLKQESSESNFHRLQTIHQYLQAKYELLKTFDDTIINACETDDIEHEIEEADEVLLRILDTIREIEMSIKRRDVRHSDRDPSQNTQVSTNDLDSNSTNSQDNDSDSDSTTNTQIPSTSRIPISSPVNTSTLPSSTTQATSFQTTQIQDVTRISNQVRPKLPKISLPRFNGDVTKFQTFWDSFDSAINQNQNMSVIDKFNYLKGLLDGQASRAIQGLTLSEANYEAALKLIQDRFGKVQKIISTHMDNLLKLPCCNETNYKASQLRNVYDIVSVNIRGLESLGVRAAQYGSFLIPILMEKMPNDVQLQIARVSSKDIWELDELLEVIKTEVEARELCETVRIRPKTESQVVKQFKKPTPTASSLVVRDNHSFKITCVYCSGDHYSSSCQDITDIKARKDILKETNRCFVCLRTGHTAAKCESQKTCRKCNGRHQQSICDGTKSKPEATTSTHVTTTTTVTSNSQNARILLQTATAYAVSDKDSTVIPVRLLFDGCSQKSYITTETQSKLGLRPVKNEKLNINTFGKDSYTPTKCDLVDIRLQNKHGEEFTIQARTFSSICSPIYANFDVKQYSYLQHLDLADDSMESNISQPTDILIGADFYWLLVTGDTIREPNGPAAVESVFGWLISGPVNSPSDKHVISNLIISDSADLSCMVESNTELIDNLKTFWDTEAIGISDEPLTSTTCSIHTFLKDIRFDTELQRYEVQLPWNGICLPGSNNYDLCHSRLRHLFSRLKKNISHLHQYNDIIQEQLRNGIIEKVPDQGFSEVETCFMPHHGVVREDKNTTKLRIVFDGSAKSENAPISLNNCLDKGPNFTPLIFDVLTNFRLKPIGLIADIEKAFHQIIIHPNDRDMLRFLWFNDTNTNDPEIVQYRFQRLVFGLISSPAILNCVIKHHLEKEEYQNNAFVKQLSESLYVDDFSGGAFSEEEAYELYKQSKQIFKDGGFNLRKWNSNSKALRDKINAREEQSNLDTSRPTLQSESKILGLTWDTIKDEFRYDVSDVLDYIKTLQPTKRSILKVSAKIFDPLGLLSPFSVKMKILFQQLCESKVNWDDNLSSTHQTIWDQLADEFFIISKIRIPRCLHPTGSNVVFSELHGFSDASEKAYAAVVYFRTVFDNGDVQVRLIAAKTRVAPKKQQTIPRLELLGALILARLMYTIQSVINTSLGPLPKTYWTDSFTTLCWIKNVKPWKQYVQHRVDEIRLISEKTAWRFCPGLQNPSDIPSRSCSAFELLNNNVWWDGPIFLHQPPEEWPDLPTSYENTDSYDELQKHPKTITHSLVTVETTSISIIDVTRHTSITKLLRITALVLKFPRLLRKQQISKSISSEDIKEAETLWLKEVQSTVFSKELSSLKNNLIPTNYTKQFGLFLDDNHILRCQGRIGNSVIPEFSKHPILLPANHQFTRLIIQHHHQGVHHNGIRETLNSIREQYWIIRGRESVKKFIRRCVICKKFEGRPYSTPPVPDLPPDRVSIEPPFTNTGLDFAGPLFVKSTTDPNTTFKSYVCLFTCSSTRAVHFELTTDLTVNAFLQAFRRFASRRGLPTRLLSDNAKTFTASAKEVTKIVRSEEISDYLINKQVSWENIVEKAPWWGGFWERLVRSLKRCLKKTIGRSSLTFEELRTIIIEIETTLNNRPITYIYDDENGTSYPLTPSDLIYGRRISTSPSARHYDITSTNKSLTKRAKYHYRLLDNFCKLWQKEYILSLQENVTKSPRQTHRPISLGDIVILKNDNTSRTFWKLARVTELYPGRDNQIRSAKIQVLSSANRNPIALRRPIQHLIPLEVPKELPSA